MSDAQFMARVFAFMLSMLLLCAGATSLIRAGLDQADAPTPSDPSTPTQDKTQ